MKFVVVFAVCALFVVAQVAAQSNEDTSEETHESFEEESHIDLARYVRAADKHQLLQQESQMSDTDTLVRDRRTTCRFLTSINKPLQEFSEATCRNMCRNKSYPDGLCINGICRCIN